MDRRRGHPPVWIWSLALSLLAVTATVLAAGPQVTVNRFRNLPARFFYFEDTSVLVYHDYDAGNVYISDNEGKDWKRADDIPEKKAAMVIPHPTNNRIAFVLTNGTTHYKTDNRGGQWQSFEVPDAPAWVANPLSFHAGRDKSDYILYQGRHCERVGGWGMSCRDDTYYTEDSFTSTKELLKDTTSCMFAHGRKEFQHEAPENLVYCVGFDETTREGGHTLSASRIFSSTDFFNAEMKVEDLGIGENARGVVALTIVSKYAVAALKDVTPGSSGDMLLYVTTDTKEWKRVSFPHGSSARLRENAFTIVESLTHSLGVDVILDNHQSIGTLFVSSSDGTQFMESLRDTNRNDAGYVDFENVYGVEGVGIANIVKNAKDVESRRVPKQLQSRITFDDGHTWTPLKAPLKDVDGKDVNCNTSDSEKCSLHLHSISAPHNYGRIFSSPAPGFVMGVGSIGEYLRPYAECDTFLSTDAGVTWTMVHKDAYMHEFGDQGGIIVMANDEEASSSILYSLDLGKTWKEKELGVTLRARALTTISDLTSQKFVMLGQLSRKDGTAERNNAAVYVDFKGMRSRRCGYGDMEKWYARKISGKECVMGHKQWYIRRKPGADCYMGEKFQDPVEHEENCPCEEDDYECDFNFVRQNGKCVASGPEQIGTDVCRSGNPGEEYKGSSGYRRIPGNTCDKSRGRILDEPVNKKCGDAAPAEGEIIHHIFKFPAGIVQHQYFNQSQTLLVRLSDQTIWQSSNEGWTWSQLGRSKDKFLYFYMHKFVSDRGYLILAESRFLHTTNSGRDWHEKKTPTMPNSFGIPHLFFHPTQEENIIWIGEEGCDSRLGQSCTAVAHYSLDNGRHWHLIDRYVRNCEWARDKQLKVDSTQIICERYRDHQGDQRLFTRETPIELISGTNYFEKGKQKTLFNQVLGFTKVSDYLIVAEVKPERTLSLQVSLDGNTFAPGLFPPGMKPETRSFTILESSTDSLFVYMTVQEGLAGYGSILKSNSNGTYFGVSVDYVNRDSYGYVDFEKMIGIDGVGLINVVANPRDAVVSGRKAIQSRITHNDGGSWKPITPPKTDSNGQPYACSTSRCHLHVHGYTERLDPLATYSTPSVPGLLIAVGNVGEYLLPYMNSDTFLSRDAGFTWEEVHKDAHLWEFGDSGSVLVAANDEGPTDHVLFTTNEGMKWWTYKFTEDKLRVKKIITVPTYTGRKFVLLCESTVGMSVAVQIDFSSLTNQQCKLDLEKPGDDDFELWSPSEEREEQCLFGRQTLYHRRKRERECFVGDIERLPPNIVDNCPCKESDFECEYNHARDADGNCVLIEGEKPLANDDSCRDGSGYWYERTAYRKIAHSTCEGGPRPDRGTKHTCATKSVSHRTRPWLILLALPVLCAAVVWWWYRVRGTRGVIRLPEEDA